MAGDFNCNRNHQMLKFILEYNELKVIDDLKDENNENETRI